ncbi:MAG: succinate-semialdehyde dehydrogenase, partial [Firmicutes bacterium]|nr:succinate-semialdehyde dehydrogenase [Bacillota bacterium]
GPISRKVVGQSVQKVAELVGVEVPEGTRMILIKARSIGREEPLCREKMCPVMIAYPYDTFEEAVEMAQRDLDIEGRGHTTAVHSNDMEHIKYAGEHLTVSRLIVNQTSSTGAGGSLMNGFSPTTTLGCGSWGNNSISENLNYTHLINVSQIGLCMTGRPVPTDEEIWG